MSGFPDCGNTVYAIWFVAPYHYYIIWLSNLLTLSILYDGYSRNESSVQKLISMSIIRSSFDNTYRHGMYCGTQRDALKTQVVKPHLCMKSMLIITTCVENTGCERHF
jgi:hypothetical protein